MTERIEVRVVCPHDTVATFVASSVPGGWIVRMRGAERVTGRWRHPMRCDRCRLDVPVNKQDTYGPILDWLVRVDNPAITRVAPTVVEVPLKVMADALGASRRLPE